MKFLVQWFPVSGIYLVVKAGDKTLFVNVHRNPRSETEVGLARVSIEDEGAVYSQRVEYTYGEPKL